MWLSFIIPLYNCAGYVSKCLDNILRQGLAEDEYEVVIVNDGSTDESAKVVQEYCAQHSNFRLINKENGGVASARNRGLDEARGKYVHFIDADDYLLPLGMKELRDNYVKRYDGVDMVIFSSCTVDRYYNPEQYEKLQPHRMLIAGTFREYAEKFGTFGWSSCLRLLKRDFLKTNNKRFENYAIGEDVWFMMNLFRVADASVVVTNLNIYRYVVRGDSSLNRNDSSHAIRAFKGYMEMSVKIAKLAQSKEYDSRLYDKEVDQFRKSGFIRLVTSNLSYTDMKLLLSEAFECGFYPIRNESDKMTKVMNMLTKNPRLMWCFSKPMRYIYIYLKPFVKRN